MALGLTDPPALTGQRDEDRDLVVRSLGFDGNRWIDDFTLGISVATSQSSFFARFPLLRWFGLGAKRYFDQTEFRRDVLRVTALYRRSGFREVAVDTVVRRTGNDVHLRFLIDEGEPVRVRSLDIIGVEGIIRERALARDLPLRINEPFNLLLLQASADTIRSRLRDRGYPFPDVYLNYDVSTPARTADVVFDAAPGTRARIDAIVVTGAEKVDTTVVRRSLSVRRGQLFSERAMLRSRLDLYRTNMFNVVTIGLADTVPPAVPDTSVTVHVQVSEASFRRIRLGAGYGTIDCFRTLTSFTIYDFLGGGRTFDLSTRLSKIGTGSPFAGGFEQSVCPQLRDENPERLKLNYNVTATLREPFFLSRRRIGAALSATAERHTEFQAFARESYGGDLAITWQTPVRVPLTASYGLSTTRTDAEPAIFCAFLNVCRVEDTRVFRETFRRRSVVSLGVVWDRSDSPLDPTRGVRLSGELRYAGEAIGSDRLIQFTRGVAEFASYHRVGRRSVFAWRVRAGAIHSPQLPEAASDQNRFVPPEDRFYGGGPNSVRGFGQNELGPLVRVLERDRDTVGMMNGEPITEPDSLIRPSAVGGEALIFANAEVRFPFPGFSQRVSAAAFVDAGQVFAKTDDFALSRIRVTPGLGIRVATALGPVRLDVAYNPYDATVGDLYQQQENGMPGCRTPVTESCELVKISESYPEVQRERGLLKRLQLHFSVGQAF